MAATILRTVGNPSLLQGDFNIDTDLIEPYMPRLFKEGSQEIAQPQITKPGGGRFDHVLFSGLTAISQVVYRNALTDHFPVTAELAYNL